MPRRIVSNEGQGEPIAMEGGYNPRYTIARWGRRRWFHPPYEAKEFLVFLPYFSFAMINK